MAAWEGPGGRELIGLLPSPVIVIDSEGEVLEANPCAQDLFERESFEGVNVEALLTQPERARLDPLTWLRKWAQTPDAPELNYVYLTCVTASGKEKSLSIRVAKVGAEDPCYIVTMHDMSVWLQRFVRERDSHRLAARLLSIMADGVVLTDPDQRITFANRSMEQLLDYPQGALLGLHLNDLIPARFRAEHTEHVDRFAHGKSPSRLMGERRPVYALTRTGAEVLVEASISRLQVQGAAVFCALLRSKSDMSGIG